MRNRRFHLPLSLVILNLFLAILPIVSGIVIYNRILAVVSEDLAESNLRVLKKGIEKFDENYTNLGKFIFPLKDNLSIIRCKNIQEPYSEGNVIRLLEVLNDFSLIQSSREEDHILDSFLYFCTNEVVVTPLSIYRGEVFFRDQIQFTSGEQIEWFRDLKKQTYSFKIIPQQDILYNGKEYRVNLLVHSLYFGKDGTEVYYISLLNERFFLDQLDSFDLTREGRLTVLQDKRIMFQYGEDISLTNIDRINLIDLEGKYGYQQQRFGDSEPLISYVYSPLRQITYILEQNSLSQISNVVRNMSRIVIFGGILYVFFASLISFLLTKRSRITLFSSHKIARDSIMNALYHGDIIDADELERAWERLNLDNNARYWGISLLAVNPLSSLLVNELLMDHNIDVNHLQSTLNEIVPSLFSFHYPESNRLLLIHSFTDEDRNISYKQWLEELNGLVAYFSREKDLDIYMGMGNLQENKMQLFNSYAQARQALNIQARTQKPGIGQYGENEPQRRVEIPKNLFSTLETYIYQENLKGIETVFSTIEKILFDPNLTFVLKQYLITRIYGEIIDISDRIGRNNLINLSPEFFGKINTGEGIGEVFHQLEEKTKFICAQISHKKKSHNMVLLDKVLDQIQNNLENQNLNASLIAELCGITETYLYQFFKEQTGQTFAVYMENKRLEKAKELLLNSALCINEIAGMVGYGSSNTFCRAFKRKMGYSAGKFRENQKNPL